MRNSPILQYRERKNIKEQLYMENRLKGLKTQIEKATKYLKIKAITRQKCDEAAKMWGQRENLKRY